MTDGYWNMQQPPLVPPQSGGASSGALKRPRTDFDHPLPLMSSNPSMQNYYPRTEDYGSYQAVKDTKTIGSAYDRYLQNAQASAFPSGEGSNTLSLGGAGAGRGISGGMTGFPIADAAMMGRPQVQVTAPDLVPNGRENRSVGQPLVDPGAWRGRETVPLPPDASNTLYVEGLPPDCTRREVAHIFRPFVGYKQLRLVTKDSKHRGGDPIILCFVDFESPACAATAMSALQGYKMDEHEAESKYLRLQFSRFPGPRSGGPPGGGRGKR